MKKNDWNEHLRERFQIILKQASWASDSETDVSNKVL